MTDGDELGDPRRLLGLEQPHGIGAVSGGLPVAVDPAGQSLANGPAQRRPLRDGQIDAAVRCHHLRRVRHQEPPAADPG